MNRTTLDAARSLLLSKLRLHIYREKATVSSTNLWSTLAKLEEGFVRAHKEVWKEELTTWDLAGDTPPELLGLIADALEQAIEDTVAHFESLPPDLVTEMANQWRSDFQPGDLVTEGVR